MANIINVVEENNILSFKEEPLPIVCGNTNYALCFEFSEEWQTFLTKIAVFEVDGKKKTIEFEGAECQIPAMPNASTCAFYVIAGNENEKSLISTALKLKLVPSATSTVEDDFEEFKNYLTLALETLRKFERGEYIAKEAKTSQSQVDRESDQTIDGSKDFVGELKFKGKEVAVVSQVSNPNLLLNGDFKINQRDKTTHLGKNAVYTYTVDRWRLFGVNSTFNVSTKKLSIYKGHSFSQIIEVPEYLKGKTVTACLNISEFSKEVEVFLTDGVNEVVKATEVGDNILTFTIGESAETVEFGLRAPLVSAAVYPQWAKLEVGEKFTGFISKPYASELLDCQRYFYRKASASNYGTLGVGCCLSTPEVRIVIDCPTTLRTSPTMRLYGDLCLCSIVDEEISGYYLYSFDNDSLTLTFTSQNATPGMGAILRKDEEKSYIEFDAEIY